MTMARIVCSITRTDELIAEPAVRRHAIVPCMAPSAQRPHPAGDGPPDLVRRIFLDKMDPRDRHLGLRWPPAHTRARSRPTRRWRGSPPGSAFTNSLGTPLVASQSA